MNLAIIGANGFIGQAISRAASRAGLLHTGYTRDDVIDPEEDFVIDCNGNSKKFQSNENPELGYREIVESVKNRIAQTSKSQKYVYISSGEVYGNQQNKCRELDAIVESDLSNYGRFKYQAEEIVREKCPSHLIIRPSGFVGIGLKKNPIYDLLYNDKLYVNPDSRFQFCDVDWFGDVVIQLLLGNSEGIFNVTSLGTISVQEIMSEFNLRMSEMEKSIKLELHELDTTKLQEMFTIPDTESSVFAYILDVIENRG